MNDNQLIEFFQIHHQRVENFGFMNTFEEREDRLNYRKGEKLLKEALDMKTKV